MNRPILLLYTKIDVCLLLPIFVTTRSPRYKVTTLLRGPSPCLLAGTTSASACNPNYLCISMPEILPPSQYHHFTARLERKSAAWLIAIFDLSLWLKCILKTSYKCSLKVQSNFLLIRLHLKSGTEARAVPSPLLPFTFSDRARTGG